MIAYILAASFSYLIGSIPAGYLAGRLVGVDIRREGSGNIGATNVLRVLGKGYGYAVFLFDFCKGTAAVLLSILLQHHFKPGESDQLIAIIGGIMSVIGHSYPIWLRFKGGKGVATSVGVVFGLMPIIAIIVLAIWLLIFQLTKYVSVASIVAALSLPITTFLMTHLKQDKDMTLVYFSAVLTIVIVWRHRSNLARLRKGTEQSFKRK